MSSSLEATGPRTSSDYGSDLGDEGEAELSQLLDEIEVRHRAQSQPLVLESLKDYISKPAFAVVPVRRDAGESFALEGADEEDGVHVDAVPQLQSLPRRSDDRANSVEPVNPSIPDTRTPLERFRTAPKKPLSVTDLVSPAWCELQYWYILTKHGRKKRTPAMKQGSAVHKKLEEEVHTAVPVDVQTREDVWGLRIWNVVQGLRTLRVTGRTRELEVWGVVGGEVVNGIVDELAFTCADVAFAEKVDPDMRKEKERPELPSDQSTLQEFFKPKDGETLPRSKQEHRKIYLTDVKTRSSATLPAGASLRPTNMQLMLYRTLLTALASNAVDPSLIFARYSLNPTTPFSDTLIAQLGSLDLNFRSDSTESTYAPIESPVDTVVELLTHNSLMELWALMIQEFQITMPRGKDSVSKVLRAEFRSQKDGKVIGARMFVHGEQEVEEYVRDEMSWWKGEREARGVDVEEAFKCRICEFAAECTWRNTKIEDAVRKSRERGKVVGKGGG